MTTNKHSYFGASGAERWMHCPGSVALCASLPPPPESKYAEEGTAAHKVAELCLLNKQEPEEFVSRIIEGVEVTPEMAEAVKEYTDTVRQHLPHYATLFVEKKFALTDFDPEFFGTNDAAIVTKAGELIIFDYKHGAGVPVYAKDNPQLKYYALGALYEVGAGVSRVTLCVVQPRCEQRENPVDTWETTPAELIEFGFELATAAKIAREADAPLNDGKWCKFCAAKGVCPKLYEAAQEAAQLEFEDARDATQNSNASLTPDELGRRLELVERVKVWAGAIQQYAYNEAIAGRMPAGRKFVAKRGRRAWKDSALAISQAVRVFDVSEDELLERKPISPAAFEKVIGKTNAREFMMTHAEMKQSGFSLVPLSDKREALTSEALSEFEAIEEFNDD